MARKQSNNIDVPMLPQINYVFFAGKRRRAQADFPGADIILKQISEKPSRKRVGIISSGPPARGRYKVAERPVHTDAIVIPQ